MEKFALRGKLRYLIRIAGIARPCALYDAPVAARTFEECESAYGNPIVSDEVVEDNVSEVKKNYRDQARR